MLLHCRRSQLILLLTCAFQAFAAGQSTPIKTPPVEAQIRQSAEKAQAPAASDALAVERALYKCLLFARYSYFFEFVGRENYLVQQEGEERNFRRPVERTDYETAIGIGDGEEQAMLDTILETSQQIIEAWDQIDAAKMKFVGRGAAEKVPNDPEIKALYQKLDALVEETRVSLRHDVGKDFLKKLDSFVYWEFVNREGRASSRRSNSDSSASIGVPQLSSKHRYTYAHLFQIGGNCLESKQWNSADVKDAQGGTPRVVVPENQWQAVRAIIIDAHDRLRENDLQRDAAIGEFHRQSGPQPIPRDNLYQLDNHYWAIIDDGIKQLKQLLEQKNFDGFDESVVRVFGAKEIAAAASDSSGRAEPHKPSADPAPAQTTSTRP